MSDRGLDLLLTQAWQLTLVILVVAILARRIARKRPHLAVALWLIVLAKAMTPPVWCSPVGVFSWTIPITATSQMEVERARSTSLPTAVSAPLLSPEPLPAPSTELISLPDEPEIAVLPFELASPTETIPQPFDVEPVQPARWSWAAALLAIWLSGAVLTLLVICSRLLHLRRTLSRAGSGPDAELAGRVETLRNRLKLRRQVRVWVTPTDHGPAVLGLFRPWLLLPKTLVDSVAPDDLEPLLAHELLHIRRGDLWIGWWQALVQAAWWLHPLVWWSNRVLTRQLERCCDEEVLAELGCEPGRYARGLLKALELKHRLRPVPAAPGVRPVDLTAERMERIMRMGQGSHRRTPWWCWAVMGMGLLVALPGAGLKLGAEEPGQVFLGVGVNSEAGVTGTVILGEDDATPADASEPATVVSGKDFELRGNSLRMNSVEISGKNFEVRADSIRGSTSAKPVTSPGHLLIYRTPPPGNFGNVLVIDDAPITAEALQIHSNQSNNQLLQLSTMSLHPRLRELQYPAAMVEYVSPPPESPRDTVLKFHKGPQLKLLDVRDETGVSLLASDSNVGQVRSADSDMTNGEPLPKSRHLTAHFQSALPADWPPWMVCSRLECFYRDLGFFNAKVTSETVSAERRDYMVACGPKFVVRHVEFDAACNVRRERLRTILDIEPGQRFCGDHIRNRAELLRLQLGRATPVFSRWMAIPHIEGDQAVVDLAFNSEPDLTGTDWSHLKLPPRAPTYSTTRKPLHAWPQDAPVVRRPGDNAFVFSGFHPRSESHILGEKPAADSPAEQPEAKSAPAKISAGVQEGVLPLDQRVTMTIKDRPLDELLAELASKYKISFVIDIGGIEEEGVLSSIPVSGEFHNVTLRTMLTLLVESHNLVAHEQDRVLKITSRGRAEPLEVRIYSIADLIAPHPNEDTKQTKSEEAKKGAVTPAFRSKELIELIQSTVTPDSWIEGGGRGQIRFFETTLSLVIRQRPSIHEQIAELFDQLRRRLDTHVVLQVGDRVVTAEDWKALSPDGNRQPIVWDVEGLRTANLPKMTLLNGEQASLASELFSQPRERADLWSFDVIAVISEDRRSLTLTLLPTTYRSRFKPRSINVPDGKTLLLDVSDTLPPDDPSLQNGAHVVLELTPKIVVVPEEEEPLNK